MENPPSPLHDLHVVNAEQLEATYGITTEAVLLTDQAHRQLWANSAYDTLLSSHTHTDACPQAVSLSCYAYHDPASVECRCIIAFRLALIERMKRLRRLLSSLMFARAGQHRWSHALT